MRAAAALAALALCALPLTSRATPQALDAVEYKVKPADGNLWSARYRGGRLVQGHCRRRCVAFTFDDGPNWETTPRLLDALEQRGLRAAFFVTGHRMDGDGDVARRNRALLRDEWRHGHLIGNHTYHHDVMDRMNPRTLQFEIDRTAEIIRQELGQRVFLFRAPYGALASRDAVQAVFSREYTPVFWAMDSNDWRVNTPEAVLANVRAELDRVPHGGVLLMHDTLPWSVDAFPLIVDELARRSEALMARGEEPYEIVGMERFYEPLRATAQRGGAGARGAGVSGSARRRSTTPQTASPR